MYVSDVISDQAVTIAWRHKYKPTSPLRITHYDEAQKLRKQAFSFLEISSLYAFLGA